jgi:arylamine N-acetyltransferase
VGGDDVTIDPAEAFCDSYSIRPRRPDRELLDELGLAFARLPYENLTKLIKKHQLPPGPERRRLPAEVIEAHIDSGAGGTCFALTTLFGAVLERLGFRCRPALCDMRNRPDSHCTLLVELDAGLHLLDPGYLLHRPVPLSAQPETTVGPGARLLASPDGASFDLYTYDTWRYRLKLEPVSAARFQTIWDASFDWTMMNGVHVCAATPDGYAYVHNHRMRLREGEGKHNQSIRGHETAALAIRFGISPTVVEEAYRLVAEARSGSSRHD